jgi:hypothetical protein
MAKRTVSRAKKKPAATGAVSGAAAGQDIAVIDAGPAPIDFIKRAQALSAGVTIFDAGPTRTPVPRPKGPPDLPLNPLRAGAAIARRAVLQESVAQFGGPTQADADGGGAPKLAARKKRPQRARKPEPPAAGQKRKP